MESTTAFAYESPEIVETFSALEIMGSAEGFEVYLIGNGSTLKVD